KEAAITTLMQLADIIKQETEGFWERRCQYCGVAFLAPKDSKQKYCSKECPGFAQSRDALQRKLIATGTIRNADRKTTYCIDRLYDGHNGLLYIGISKQGISRLKAHCKQQSWAQEICFIDIQDCADEKAAAIAIEKRAIITEKPKYNIVHNILLSLE